MMNKVILLAIILAITSCGKTDTAKTEEGSHDEHSAHDTVAADDNAKPKSPRKAVMTNIGPAHIHIDYSSPSVRGRTVWGGLVSYGEVWVTGAHKATSINFPNDVKINGQPVPRGKYALFTIPEKDEWTIIINTNWDQHLADDYDQAEDVVRIKVKPETLDKAQEALKYEVVSGDGNSGTISISWDKLKVAFDVEVV